MNGYLSLHCGASTATLEKIKEVQTPSPTQTWEPIPHINIIETLLEQAKKTGFEVKRESYGLSKSGSQLFGVIDFASGTDDYSYAVGFRNSHDKSWAAGVCAGHRVFVCDNLAFSGEYIEKRKHTTGNGFLGYLKDAFAVVPQKLEDLTKNLNRLKTEELTDDEARLVIFKAFETNAITSSRIGQVWGEYKQPTFEEFADSTKYNLLMAFTEIAKKESSVMALERMYNRTSGLFGLN